MDVPDYIHIYRAYAPIQHILSTPNPPLLFSKNRWGSQVNFFCLKKNSGLRLAVN